MQSGLNIGIGSWIDSQYSKQTLPAFPSLAIPFELKDLSVLKTPEDLRRIGEFSLYVNRLDSVGSNYGMGKMSPPLWRVHKNILSSMVSATSTLTLTEKEAIEAANKILFSEDGVSPSKDYQMYRETERIYQDLVLDNADSDDITVAYENWIIFGHKEIIENAIATRVRLITKSSNVTASEDISKIDLALSSLGRDIEYIPTYFTPISALSTEHWLEAEVDFQVLENSIKPQVSMSDMSDWKQFRANKIGSVRFKYIGIDLLRPWFSEEIYEASDWNFSENIASGNGLSGKIPWFFSKLYMATILDVRLKTIQTTRPTRSRPSVGFPKKTNLVHPLATFNKPRVFQTDRKLSINNSPPLGTALMMNNNRHGALPRTRVLNPAISVGRMKNGTRIKKTDAILVKNRFAFTLDKLSISTTKVAEQKNNTTTYIVGFGRKNLPFCPNPNPKFQW